MRVSTMILPSYRWRTARGLWQRADAAGFHAAYTVDHLSWRSFRDTEWYAAMTTLTAAAAVTERIRLGTLVASPNFRHPVTLAKEAMSVDDVSGGRLVLGLGAGTGGFDATVLGHEPWSPRERADRFAEFVELTDALLTADATTYAGRFYSAHEARMIPRSVQSPRVPMAIAAAGPRGMRLTARHGQAWVTYGDPQRAAEAGDDEALAAVAAQVRLLEDVCAREGRPAKEVERILLAGQTTERPLASLDAFVDFAGRYAGAGITEIVLPHPIPDTVYDVDPIVFDRIVSEGLPQVAGF